MLRTCIDDPQVLETFRNQLASAPTNRVVSELRIDGSLTNLDRVQSSLLRAGDFLIDSPQTTSARYMGQLVDGLDRLSQGIRGAEEALGILLSQMTIEGYALKKLQDDFKQILAQLVDCFKNEDSAAFLDKAEFEMLPNLCAWKRVLERLRESLSTDR